MGLLCLPLYFNHHTSHDRLVEHRPHQAAHFEGSQFPHERKSAATLFIYSFAVGLSVQVVVDSHTQVLDSTSSATKSSTLKAYWIRGDASIVCVTEDTGKERQRKDAENYAEMAEEGERLKQGHIPLLSSRFHY